MPADSAAELLSTEEPRSQSRQNPAVDAFHRLGNRAERIRGPAPRAGVDPTLAAALECSGPAAAWAASVRLPRPAAGRLMSFSLPARRKPRCAASARCGGAGRLARPRQRSTTGFDCADCPQAQQMFFSDQAELFPLLRTPGCLRYDIGTCLGPCAGACTLAGYTQQTTGRQGVSRWHRSCPAGQPETADADGLRHPRI